MRVLIISGSRNPNGQTARAANAFHRGITNKKNEYEILFLPHFEVERCRQCEDNGWGICRREGRCTIEDDFAGLVDQIRLADAVVFATPVYIHDLSESLQAFLNRLYRICKHKVGNCGIHGKRVVGICVAGGSGKGAIACAARLEKVLTFCGFETVDIIPISRQNLEVKLTALKEMGKSLF